MPRLTTPCTRPAIAWLSSSTAMAGGGCRALCGFLEVNVRISMGDILMESLGTIWNLFLLLSMLSFPQFLGVLAYFRIRKYHDLSAHLIGVLLPPLSFFYLARVITISSAVQEAQSRGEVVCGTFAGMMVIALLFGAGLQATFSLITQLMLHARHRGGATSA